MVVFTLSVLGGSPSGLGSISLKGIGGHLALPASSLQKTLATVAVRRASSWVS